MPLVLDIFGVILLQSGLNTPLLELCAQWRKNGEKVFGASNMTAVHNRELWQQPGIRDAFDEIYCSGQLGVGKPDPLFFNAVTLKIGVLPEQLLFFDDSGINVEAAQSLGWEAYVFSDSRDLQSIADGFFVRQRTHKQNDTTDSKAIEMDISWAKDEDDHSDDKPAS